MLSTSFDSPCPSLLAIESYSAIGILLSYMTLIRQVILHATGSVHGGMATVEHTALRTTTMRVPISRGVADMAWMDDVYKSLSAIDLFGPFPTVGAAIRKNHN